MAESKRAPGRRGRLALVVGALVAVATLSLGLVTVLTLPARWSAEASILVLPGQRISEPDVLAGLYDTLSQGQVTATYAELLRMLPTRTDDQPEGLPPETEQSVAVQVEVIPETSVIRATATAGSPSLAERAADAVVDGGRRYVSELDTPYRVQRIGSAAGSAERTGPSVPLLVGVVVALAVVVGVAAGEAVRQFGALLVRRRVGALGPAVAAMSGPGGVAESLFQPDEAPTPVQAAAPTWGRTGGGRHRRRRYRERRAPMRSPPVPGLDVPCGARTTAPPADGTKRADRAVPRPVGGLGGGVPALAAVVGSPAQQAVRQLGTLLRRPGRETAR